MIEVLALEVAEVELVGDHGLGDVLGEFGITRDRREVARSATLVGRAIAVAHTQREVAVVVQERVHVIVVDIDQNVRALLAQPLLYGFLALEDRLPYRISNFLASLAKAMVGVCAVAMPPTICAMVTHSFVVVSWRTNMC